MSRKITFIDERRWRALRRALAICALVVSAISGSAETYVLNWESINSAVSMKEEAQSYSTVVSPDDDVSWHLDMNFITPSRGITTIGATNGRYYLLFRTSNNYLMGSVTLKSDFFKDKMIKSVIVDARCYAANATGTDIQTVTITDNSQQVASQSIPVNIATYLKDQQPVISFTLDRAIQGALGISFTSTVGFEFAINAITIEYESEVPPVVNLDATIPVGLPLWLTADKADAAIYYTVDGTEDWQTYNPERGIVFGTPGTYTLKYYAAGKEVASKVVSETIKVVKPIGLDAARAANEEITVTGEVCGRGNGYVLIGEDEQCDPADCVAIATANYTQLQSVTVGTKITATGRPTDSFGPDVKALGSISALEINGTPSEPTAINAVVTHSAEAPQYYDLTGRRVDHPTSHVRRILISTDGEKRLSH